MAKRDNLDAGGIVLVVGFVLLGAGLIYALGPPSHSEARGGSRKTVLRAPPEPQPTVTPPVTVSHEARRSVAEPEPVIRAEATPATVVPASSRAEQAALAAFARRRVDVEQVEERVVWTDGERTQVELVVNGVDPIELAIQTSDGRLRVAPHVFTVYQTGPPTALPALLQQAVGAGLELEALALRSDPRTGPRLQSGSHVVFPDAVLPRVPASIASGLEASLRTRLSAAANAFIHGLSGDGLDPTSRKAIAAVLGLVGERDEPSHQRLLPPSTTRRLIRHGWLTQLDVDPVLRRRFEAAVAEAETMRAWNAYESDDGLFASYRDSFGRRNVVVRTPGRSSFSRTQPPPEFFSRVPVRTVVVDMPPGSDPTADGVMPVAARAFVGAREVAAWDAEDGFAADGAVWDQVVRPEYLRKQRHLAPNWFPPHLLVTDAEDDVLLLVTAHGEIRPAAGGSPAEARRFMDEVARALPDSGHLDLIGELLYDYAWDTPQSDRPLLVGTYEYNGDTHQTLPQTLATCTGGTYRGDCDDLADFYHALARHQGRNAHVLSLPSHLACAWAEPLSGGKWAVHVLHTGRPHRFVGASAADAIRTAYEHFDASEVLDPSALPVSLRFSGEPTREEYLLGARIFTDASYADELIRVQSDWHLHTYFSGIHTMTQVVEREGAMIADHGELAALYEAADMRVESIAAYERAIALAVDPQTRVSLMTRRLSLLIEGKDDLRASKQARALLMVEIPALESARGTYILPPWIEVAAMVLGRDRLAGLGIQVLARQVVPRLEASFDRLRKAIASDDFDPYLLVYDDFPMHTGNLSAFVSAGVSAIEVDAAKLSSSARKAQALVEAATRRWIDEIAFPILKDSDSVLDNYAFIAGYHAAHSGFEAFLSDVRSVAAPTEVLAQRRPAELGGAPSPETLRFVSIAPAYWEWVWLRALIPPEIDDAKNKANDVEDVRTRVLDAVRRHGAALDAADALGLGHTGDPARRLQGQVLGALISKDAAALEQAFAAVASRRDRRLEDDIAGLIGQTAQHLELAWFTEVMKRWGAALDHKPNHFRIVWAAIVNKAPAHGLVAARMAVAHYPDDAAFRAELRHLETKPGSPAPK